MAIEFRSIAHKVVVTPPKEPMTPGKFDVIGPLPHGTKVELVIELPPEMHRNIKDIEFRARNMTNTWKLM